MKNLINCTIIVFLLFSNVFYSQKKRDYFVLNGVIHGDYKGYLYLEYNETKDSCLVTNNKFYFRGKTPVASTGFFTLGRKPTVMDQDFYLENADIKMEITLAKKTVNNFEFDWVKINSVSGTKISVIERHYENFKTKYLNDKDWQTKHYEKLDQIVSRYPDNPYSLGLLTKASWDSLADNKKLQLIYKKLDLKSQSPESLLILKKNIFPVESSKAGKTMMNFELPNEKGFPISTNQYRGSILLIDFWASWCAPCRKQIPEITKVFEKYKNKNFKIVSISLDTNKEKWVAALEKEKMQWENVIDSKEFSGEIAKEYKITSIPATFLIDTNGVIIFDNPALSQIEDYLTKKLN